jgi:hypothetical protein
MNPLNRLRFKIATSFGIAILGCVTFARLLSVVPISVTTLVPFIIAAILALAGLWRGLIYLQALRGLAKS